MTAESWILFAILAAFAGLGVWAGISDYLNQRYEWIRAVREGLANARHDVDYFVDDRQPGHRASYWLRSRKGGAYYYRVYEKEYARLVEALRKTMTPEEIQEVKNRIVKIREIRNSKDPALRRRVISLEQRVVVLETEVSELKQREVV